MSTRYCISTGCMLKLAVLFPVCPIVLQKEIRSIRYDPYARYQMYVYACSSPVTYNPICISAFSLRKKSVDILTTM
ncbi:hypothetical protein F4813DRAFT_368899 [Daldinia decipiens]|uniref:uncharacterized protein n=1 Tax=Daldinia decipiens TaxID=326647 RepID=UPI0020C3734C|nr:uncharacterized protein F4813DRAFT_368899 [Daldinia decipiens]KAI1654929.1 hypothetical protein F4813DRAFT_368899 [Daldinia decipiens]